MAIEALSDIRKAGTSAWAAGGGSLTWSSTILDFGSIPVHSKSFSVPDASAVVGSKFNFVFAPTNDEAEMDMIVASGVCLTNGIITVYAHAVPGPVSGTRSFNYFLG